MEVLSGLAPDATAFSTSRSVRMPASISASWTTAEPTRCLAMIRAASRSVCAGPTVTTALLATSLTFTVAASLLVVARSGTLDAGQGLVEQVPLLLLVDGRAAGRRRGRLRAAG